MNLPEAYVAKVLADDVMLAQQKVILLALAVHPNGLTTHELVTAVGGSYPEGRRSMVQRPIAYLVANGTIVKYVSAHGRSTFYQLSPALRKAVGR